MGRFDLGGMTVDLYTTHIAAGRKPDSRRAKVVQGNELIAFVRENSPPDHTVIFTGDFNMRPSRGPEDKEENKDEPKVFVFDKIVAELGLRDASDEINGPVGTEIDRILFRPGTGVTMTTLSWQHDDPIFYDEAGEPLSDHEPVFVRFRMERP
jgi:endonuclease/exonuclease/phosphatase family metal-dependent hydrolase